MAELALKSDDVEAIRKATGELFTAGMPIMDAKTKLEQEKAKPKEEQPVNAEFTEVKDKAA